MGPHLGAKLNLDELTNGYTGLGTDVRYRASKGRAILSTMIKRGLREGAVDPQPALHIIDTTTLKSITYGLSLPHLTDTDTR